MQTKVVFPSHLMLVFFHSLVKCKLIEHFMMMRIDMTNFAGGRRSGGVKAGGRGGGGGQWSETGHHYPGTG